MALILNLWLCFVNKSYRHAVYACRKSPLTLPGHRSFGIKTNIVLVDEVTIM